MKKVKIINWKGNTYEGMWNEKYYQSQIEGEGELHRIYIDNSMIHITNEEKQKLEESFIKSEAQKSDFALKQIKELYKQLLSEQKANLVFLIALDDNISVDSLIKINEHYENSLRGKITLAKKEKKEKNIERAIKANLCKISEDFNAEADYESRNTSKFGKLTVKTLNVDVVSLVKKHIFSDFMDVEQNDMFCSFTGEVEQNKKSYIFKNRLYKLTVDVSVKSEENTTVLYLKLEDMQ